MVEEEVKKVLEEYDQNGDGVIQPHEFDQDLDNIINEINNGNGNGAVDIN